MTESSIMRAIREAINATRRARIVRNHVGFDQEIKTKYGLGVGSPDLIGVLKKPLGKCFAIEVKTPIGRLSAEQKAWWRAARLYGITGGVARSVEEALALLDEAERG